MCRNRCSNKNPFSFLGRERRLWGKLSSICICHEGWSKNTNWPENDSTQGGGNKCHWTQVCEHIAFFCMYEFSSESAQRKTPVNTHPHTQFPLSTHTQWWCWHPTPNVQCSVLNACAIVSQNQNGCTESFAPRCLFGPFTPRLANLTFRGFWK